MQKIHVFLLLLMVSLVSLTILSVAGFYLLAASPYPSSWMSDMWSHMSSMMGGTPVTTQNPAVLYFGALFVILIVLIIISIAGLVYFAAFPAIKTATPSVSVATENPVLQNTITPYASVIKTLTDEERRIIEVLKVHDGKYLQKYLRKEAGLSRLKTHRILVRLAERGIVKLEKFGNTNQVVLAEWLRD
ncbi:MAG: helix-turn-helix transcriptional regulator [Candidatus Bathyarchaeales archaeon]